MIEIWPFYNDRHGLFTMMEMPFYHDRDMAFIP